MPQPAAHSVTSPSRIAAINFPASPRARLGLLLGRRAIWFLGNEVVDLAIGFYGLLEGRMDGGKSRAAKDM